MSTARTTVLKDRNTGETLYPVTHASMVVGLKEAVNIPEISTNIQEDRLSTTKTACPKEVYDTMRVPMETTMPVAGFLPNKFYALGTISSDTEFLMNTVDVDPGILNHYYWTFDTPATAPNFDWPVAITKWKGGAELVPAGGKHYEISVINGVANYWEV